MIRILSTTQITRKLIGHIDFAASTGYDAESLRNLDEVEELLVNFTEEVADLVKLKNCGYYSGEALAKKATLIIQRIQELIKSKEDRGERK